MSLWLFQALPPQKITPRRKCQARPQHCVGIDTTTLSATPCWWEKSYQRVSDVRAEKSHPRDKNCLCWHPHQATPSSRSRNSLRLFGKEARSGEVHNSMVDPIQLQQIFWALEGGQPEGNITMEFFWDFPGGKSTRRWDNHRVVLGPGKKVNLENETAMEIIHQSVDRILRLWAVKISHQGCGQDLAFHGAVPLAGDKMEWGGTEKAKKIPTIWFLPYLGSHNYLRFLPSFLCWLLGNSDVWANSDS